MKKIFALIVLAVIGITAHANSPSKDTLRLENTTTHFADGGIDIALSYPQLITAKQSKDSTEKLYTGINSDVCRIIASIAPAPEALGKDSLWTRATSPALLELYLLNASKGLLAELQDYGGPATYDLYSEWTAFSNAHLVSIFIKTYMFTGGAHGITVGRTLNYNVATGKPIELISQIEDTAYMMDLAAIYFCKERHLPKNAIKLNTGLFYELADMPLPDQIGFTSAGLVLYWDPYSIAPYSFGPVAITIPNKELDEILAESFFKMKVASGGSKSYNQKTKAKRK